MTNLWTPGAGTDGRTSVWFNPVTKLQLGGVYFWRQGTVRLVANWMLIGETLVSPAIRIGHGVQGVGSGKTVTFATLEKSTGFADLNIEGYVGLSVRGFEGHFHELYGIKVTPTGPITVGLQFDGHNSHPFATYRLQSGSASVYLVNGKSLGFMYSMRY